MWCNDYVPDLTERYPEGFGGVDMLKPYDPEYAMWEAMEREYRCSEEMYDNEEAEYVK